MRDTNRRILPFSWGTEWVEMGDPQPEPLDLLKGYAARALARSDEFYQPPPFAEWRESGGRLTFETPIPTPYVACNRVHCRLFAAREAEAAVIVIPHGMLIRAATSHCAGFSRNWGCRRFE